MPSCHGPRAATTTWCSRSAPPTACSPGASSSRRAWCTPSRSTGASPSGSPARRGPRRPARPPGRRPALPLAEPRPAADRAGGQPRLQHRGSAAHAHDHRAARPAALGGHAAARARRAALREPSSKAYSAVSVVTQLSASSRRGGRCRAPCFRPSRGSTRPSSPSGARGRALRPHRRARHPGARLFRSAPQAARELAVGRLAAGRGAAHARRRAGRPRGARLARPDPPRGACAGDLRGPRRRLGWLPPHERRRRRPPGADMAGGGPAPRRRRRRNRGPPLCRRPRRSQVAAPAKINLGLLVGPRAPTAITRSSRPCCRSRSPTW